MKFVCVRSLGVGKLTNTQTVTVLKNELKTTIAIEKANNEKNLLHNMKIVIKVFNKFSMTLIHSFLVLVSNLNFLDKTLGIIDEQSP